MPAIPYKPRSEPPNFQDVKPRRHRATTPKALNAENHAPIALWSFVRRLRHVKVERESDVEIASYGSRALLLRHP